MRVSRLSELLSSFTFPLAGQITFSLILVFFAFTSNAQSTQSFVLQRDGRTISVEPYGPNIIRVTLSTIQAAATAHPGYGLIAAPTNSGWTHMQDGAYDVIRSNRLEIRVASGN